MEGNGIGREEEKKKESSVPDNNHQGEPFFWKPHCEPDFDQTTSFLNGPSPHPASAHTHEHITMIYLYPITQCKPISIYQKRVFAYERRRGGVGLHCYAHAWICKKLHNKHTNIQ